MRVNWKLKSNLELGGLKIVRLLEAAGFRALFVGGYVRDMMIKRYNRKSRGPFPSLFLFRRTGVRMVPKANNLDIATDATPDQVERILNKNKIATKPVGKKFGTISAIVNEALTPSPRHPRLDFARAKRGPVGAVEITTFRKEGWYSDKRHPDKVEFIKDFREDAKRRDFTINALYFDPITKEIFDPTDGIKDLGLKLIRFVGDPKKRIDEDALRMLRAVRIAAQLGSKIEKKSFAAIKTRAKYIQEVSGERIKAELDKILQNPNCAEGIRLLEQVGLLQFILPELIKARELFHKSKHYHLEGSTYDHTLLALQKTNSNDLNLIYAVLFHDLGKPFKAQPKLKNEGWVISTKGHETVSAEIFRKFAQKYPFARKDKQLIDWAIRNHMVIFHFPKISIEQRIKYAWHKNFPFLVHLARIDDEATLRSREGTLTDPHYRAWKIAQGLHYKVKKLKPKMDRFAPGEMIMRHSGLKGIELGHAIEQVKIQIVLGKIKNQADLKIFLKKYHYWA